MNELKFIHITKCAGTTIEELGRKYNILWGKYHIEYGHWHQPFNEKTINLINLYDWFVIVRNPYDRIISEYHCKWGGIGSTNQYHSIDDFNSYIQNKIKYRNIYNYTEKYPYHYMEQYKYLVNNCKIYILKFENLKEEFNTLMNQYNYNIELNIRTNTNKKVYNVNDLSKETINLINHVYKKDFELFGYNMI